MNSPFLKINLQDLLKGCIVAGITTIGMTLLPILQSGTLPTLENLQSAGIAGVTSGLAYLLKNLFTNSDGQPLKPEKE